MTIKELLDLLDEADLLTVNDEPIIRLAMRRLWSRIYVIERTD